MARNLSLKLASLLATLLLASLLVFVVMDLLPGNAAAILLGTSARPDTLAALTAQLGLDRPAVVRYGAWIFGMLRGDLGQSSAYGVPVSALITDRLAVTVPLSLMAILLSTGVGMLAGVLAAAYRGRAPDRLAALLAQCGVAMPDFWIGLLLILIFSSTLHWSSAGGFPGWSAGLTPALAALLLPAIALALPQAAVLTRVTRAAMLDVLEEDFIRTARAKGLSRRRILWRHALPNALVPVVTVIGLQLSFLVAGAVLVENVFNLPGLGRLAYQALAQRDLMVVRAVALFFAGLVIVVNGLVDLLQPLIDPRMGRA